VLSAWSKSFACSPEYCLQIVIQLTDQGLSAFIKKKVMLFYSESLNYNLIMAYFSIGKEFVLEKYFDGGAI